MTQNAAAAELFEDATGDIALGDLDAAVEKYRRCVELDPAYFDAWHALGMALMKSGRYPEAIEAGLKAVDLNPNDQLAWSSLSLFYVRNHQIKEAESAGVKARILSWGGKIRKDDAPEQQQQPQQWASRLLDELAGEFVGHHAALAGEQPAAAGTREVAEGGEFRGLFLRDEPRLDAAIRAQGKGHHLGLPGGGIDSLDEIRTGHPGIHPGHVIRRVADVLPAFPAKGRKGAGAEADVVRTQPVGEIVSAFAARAGVVGNLVLALARALERLHGELKRAASTSGSWENSPRPRRRKYSVSSS